MTLPSTVALFLIASCLSLPTATLSQTTGPRIVNNPAWSCGPGFIPVQDFGPNNPPDCYEDPCYGSPGPCGAGNTCTIKATSIPFALTVLESVCTCPAPSVVSHIVYKDFCYVPGTDRCNPSPCKNGATCEALADFNGVKGAFSCKCPNYFKGVTCELPSQPPNAKPTGVTAPPTPPTPPTPPPTPAPTVAVTGDQGVCGQPGFEFGFPVRCYFNSDPRGRYVCCDRQGCDGFNADNLTPHCKNYGTIPFNFGEKPPPPVGDQGLCGQLGSGAADFPNRCWFNNEANTPLGRYVCCDVQGCNGFNEDNLQTPRCKYTGYVPPNYGNPNGPATPPAPVPTASNNQGVCGSGAAAAFPLRCYYNNDPQQRYVCCDNDGCNGFYPDSLFPRCKTNGYVPTNL